MWIFGYGSLIWKVDFPYSERVPGFIRGYVRRFFQGSHDHRGTPEKPGRVVTLIPYEEWKQMEDDFREPDDIVCWGMAYKIADEHIEDVKKHLDFREKNGYSIHYVNVYKDVDDDEPIVANAICYIGTTKNEAFLGYAKVEHIAQQIFESIGPSGPNVEYLLNLAKATRELVPNAHDHHLFALEKRVLELMRIKDSLN
ncbi:ChaC-like protein [Paraphysoderma sedebokerense]|nr:ChaC-like protein [Paraphysoderma sedebokerense]